jgi:hypothetical protein
MRVGRADLLPKLSAHLIHEGGPIPLDIAERAPRGATRRVAVGWADAAPLPEGGQ